MLLEMGGAYERLMKINKCRLFNKMNGNFKMFKKLTKFQNFKIFKKFQNDKIFKKLNKFESFHKISKF
jgi:uncharacterized protein YjaG (DUF416 family)